MVKAPLFCFVLFEQRGLLQNQSSQTVLYLVTGSMVHYWDGRTLLDANLTSKIIFVCSSFLPFMVEKSEARAP